MGATMVEINNEMYFREDLDWWDESGDNTNTLLRYVLNPIRFNYFLRQAGPVPANGASPIVLDLGCGGGFLAEEFAKAGFRVTGMDPSPALLAAGRAHAVEQGLAISYVEGYGEHLPFDDSSFDHVACCDVLEHVNDLDRVVQEIARVLKPGGRFFYDTVNRTPLSFFLVIKVAQDWTFTAWEAPRTHVWRMFVKPSELRAAMARHGLVHRETKGISPREGLRKCYRLVRERARGRITRLEMGRGWGLRESDDASVSYMGYAVRKE
jgi:2-polyprenyl-6-hydroxyphenyl methylase / 3-demethylubiquinone-9 3-methyltransferase